MKLTSDYWENRYQKNEIGWDTGKITTPIKDYIDQLNDKTIKILIPGCGNSYEFEYLIKQGFTNVFVLDYAKSPIENLKKRIPPAFHNKIIYQNFFDHDEKYDLIMEQTFFCALDPELRKNYVQKMHTLLKDNGKLIGLLFQFPLNEQGPPFGGSKKEYNNLFKELFEIKTLETAYNSIKPRENNELFFIFTKKQHNV
jgi:SAM-dependent methyltransferase